MLVRIKSGLKKFSNNLIFYLQWLQLFLEDLHLQGDQ